MADKPLQLANLEKQGFNNLWFSHAGKYDQQQGASYGDPSTVAVLSKLNELTPKLGFKPQVSAGYANIGHSNGQGGEHTRPGVFDLGLSGRTPQQAAQLQETLRANGINFLEEGKGTGNWHLHVRGGNPVGFDTNTLKKIITPDKPVPQDSGLAALNIPKNSAEFNKTLDNLAKLSVKEVGRFAQAAITPKANPLGSFVGGLAQGASANIYQAPAINPRDAGAQGAGAFVGSLAPIVAGGAIGGLPGAAIGGGLVAGGQDYRNQMNAIQAGKATGYNPLATAAQAGIGAALTPIPFANKGGPLRNLAINSGIGFAGGASGGITDKLINPQSQVTGQDLIQQGLTGALFGGALGLVGGRSPKPIEPVATPTRQPLMLTGGKATPALPPALERLQLTGGVVDPLQGGGVRLRPEANVVPNGGGIPVQGEVLPPEPQVLQQAQQAFEANPATVLPQNPLSAVADETNRSIFMNKSAANQALKATGAPNDHVIVQDAGRYMVVPKGEPIPKAEPMFTRGQKVKVDGKDLTVINEPFGQVAVRLPDGNVRVVPREVITNQLDSLATQADQLAAFEARRAPVEAPTVEVYNPLVEQGKGKTRQEGIAELSNLMATAGENYNPNIMEVFKGAEIVPNKARNESRTGLWYDVRIPGVKKFRINADDTLSQAVARAGADSKKVNNHILGKMYDNGYIRSVQDDVARAMDDGNTTLFDSNATQDLNAGLEQKGLRDLNKADDAFAVAEVEVNNAYNQALFNVGKAKTLDDVFVATQLFDDLGPSKQELFVTPQQKAALESAVDAAIRKASAASDTLPRQTDLSTQVAETPAIAKAMEPEAQQPQVTEGQSPTRLPQALADSGFKSLDEARMVREKLGLKRSDASVIKAGKELGLTPEEALRLKAAYDNSPANVKTLLKEDIDLTTGLGQQRYGNQVPLAHESLTEAVASLTPQQREIAQVLQRAIELDRPVAESFNRQRTGATSGTAGDYGSFTPIGFTKRGNNLFVEGYNENGDLAGRLLNGVGDNDSRFNAIPRVLESQQPFVGNYANVGKELGQFKVDDILGRVTRADAIKTSDIKAAINSATDLIKNPNTPERVKRLAQQLLDDPTPAGVNKTRRKLIAEAETKTDAELERMITEMGGRC